MKAIKKGEKFKSDGKLYTAAEDVRFDEGEECWFWHGKDEKGKEKCFFDGDIDFEPEDDVFLGGCIIGYDEIQLIKKLIRSDAKNASQLCGHLTGTVNAIKARKHADIDVSQVKYPEPGILLIRSELTVPNRQTAAGQIRIF